MMSYRQGREQFMQQAGAIGIPYFYAEKLLRQATTLNRLAELGCSSESADRDRVKCPVKYQSGDSCLCRDYGSYDENAEPKHGKVPRISVQEKQCEDRVEKLLFELNESIGVCLAADYQGDPRGYVLKIRNLKDNDREYGVPSGPSGIRW